MTLEQAVEVLNREGHRQRSDWAHNGEGAYIFEDAHAVYLTEFEAIATAEKYERDREVKEHSAWLVSEHARTRRAPERGTQR